MINKVNEVYPNIPWVITPNGKMKKENYGVMMLYITCLGIRNKTYKDFFSSYLQYNRNRKRTFPVHDEFLEWTNTYKGKSVINKIPKRSAYNDLFSEVCALLLFLHFINSSVIL